MEVKTVFIHGLESSGQGTKGRFFRQRYPEMIIKDYQGNLAERMRKLETILANFEQLIIVGSSYGGLMAAIYALDNPEKVDKLILLAPALSIPEFTPYQDGKLEIPTILIHGSEDTMVAPHPVRIIAETMFSHLMYCLVEDDHVLSNTFMGIDWDQLLLTV